MPFNCSTNSYVHSPLILPAPPILVTKKFDPCSLHQNSATPTSHPNWKWRTFKNSARSDDLELSHWSISNPSVSFTQPNDSPYPFSVFNQKVDVLQYSYDEWEQAKRYYPLEWESWSKEETDYLFQMCQQWDLRFQLIADRWAPPVLDAPSRDMEDLKEHYLYMTQAILQVRFPSLDTYQQQVVARLLQYDKKKEKERKNHLLVLWERTQKEVQEEIDLHRTLLEFEDSHLQLMKDRQELLSRFYKGLDPYEITSHVTKRKKIKENQWTASTRKRLFLILIFYVKIFFFF
ncbi:swr complex subunit [Coelomomyces lativittatus]|nr:swr complex subunit [Coelomomyces lativittatus]KAJ1501049.1 swr complex subunit [Coelomomyces lativittatus]